MRMDRSTAPTSQLDAHLCCQSPSGRPAKHSRNITSDFFPLNDSYRKARYGNFQDEQVLPLLLNGHGHMTYLQVSSGQCHRDR